MSQTYTHRIGVDHTDRQKTIVGMVLSGADLQVRYSAEGNGEKHDISDDIPSGYRGAHWVPQAWSWTGAHDPYGLGRQVSPHASQAKVANKMSQNWANVWETVQTYPLLLDFLEPPLCFGFRFILWWAFSRRWRRAFAQINVFRCFSSHLTV